MPEPAMTGDLLNSEADRKHDEMESDQPPTVRRRLVSKHGVKRDDEMESDQPPAVRRRLVSKQGEKRDADQELGPESAQRLRVEAVSIGDLQSFYPVPTEISDNYCDEGEFDGVCVEENLNVDEIKKLAE